MTATIAGFVTRADAGLPDPRSVSDHIQASRGGVAVHWGGNGAPPATHDGCLARWRSWHAFHTRDRGWVDIAYNFGFCNHGYVLAGRGLRVRSAANGTNDANSRFYAAVWIGGGDHDPTDQALDALEWIVAECRRDGAGTAVRSHRSFKTTDCAGEDLTGFAASLDDREVGQRDPVVEQGSYSPPPPAQSGGGLLKVDGVLGPATISAWQHVMGTPIDGVISTPSELVAAVQEHLNTRGARLRVDGVGIRQDGREYATTHALQAYLGFSRTDGRLDRGMSLTVASLQGRLNTGRF